MSSCAPFYPATNFFSFSLELGSFSRLLHCADALASMRGLSACLVVGLFLLLASATGASAQQHEGFSSSSDFYQLIEDVVAGRDYYAILEITAEQAEQPAELKKAFRALTRRWYVSPLHCTQWMP
jgi:hypothetical protein